MSTPDGKGLYACSEDRTVRLRRLPDQTFSIEEHIIDRIKTILPSPALNIVHSLHQRAKANLTTLTKVLLPITILASDQASARYQVLGIEWAPIKVLRKFSTTSSDPIEAYKVELKGFQLQLTVCLHYPILSSSYPLLVLSPCPSHACILIIPCSRHLHVYSQSGSCALYKMEFGSFLSDQMIL